MTGTPEELLRTAEVCAWLGVKPKTLEGWRREGRGPEWQKVGRGVRYPRGAVQAWLDAQAARPRAVSE